MISPVETRVDHAQAPEAIEPAAPERTRIETPEQSAEHRRGGAVSPAEHAGNVGRGRRRWMQRLGAADVGARRAVGDA